MDNRTTGERMALIHASALVRQYRMLYKNARIWAYSMTALNMVLLVIIMVITHG